MEKIKYFLYFMLIWMFTYVLLGGVQASWCVGHQEVSLPWTLSWGLPPPVWLGKFKHFSEARFSLLLDKVWWGQRNELRSRWALNVKSMRSQLVLTFICFLQQRKIIDTHRRLIKRRAMIQGTWLFKKAIFWNQWTIFNSESGRLVGTWSWPKPQKGPQWI